MRSDNTTNSTRGEIGGLLLFLFVCLFVCLFAFVFVFVFVFVFAFASSFFYELPSFSPGTSRGWILTQGTIQVIENNGLCLEWVYYNTSDTYLDIWEAKVERHEPYLFTYWEPTHIFERFFFSSSFLRLFFF